MSSAIKNCQVIVTRYFLIDNMAYEQQSGVKKGMVVALERDPSIDERAMKEQERLERLHDEYMKAQFGLPACRHKKEKARLKRENASLKAKKYRRDMKVGARLAMGSPGYCAYVRRWNEWSRFHDEQDKLMLMRARKQQSEREFKARV